MREFGGGGVGVDGTVLNLGYGGGYRTYELVKIHTTVHVKG